MAAPEMLAQSCLLVFDGAASFAPKCSFLFFWPSLEAQLNCPILSGVFYSPVAGCSVLSELFPALRARARSIMMYNSCRWRLLCPWVTPVWMEGPGPAMKHCSETWKSARTLPWFIPRTSELSPHQREWSQKGGIPSRTGAG